MDRQSCIVSFVMIGGGLLLLLLIGSIFSRSPPRSEEHFGDVIGAAGEFRQQYFNCLNACEKTDPTKRLSQIRGLAECTATTLWRRASLKDETSGRFSMTPNSVNGSAPTVPTRSPAGPAASALVTWTNSVPNNVLTATFRCAPRGVTKSTRLVARLGIPGFLRPFNWEQ